MSLGNISSSSAFELKCKGPKWSERSAEKLIRATIERNDRYLRGKLFIEVDSLCLARNSF